MTDYEGRWTTVRVEVEEDIGWVIFNRPEKRNAMSPTLNREMREVLEALELDDAVKVLVLTGAGESWTAGMDLKEYFREIDQAPEIVQEKVRRDASTWQWKLLRMYCQAHYRHGERLVLRRRLFAARRLRSRHRIGNRCLRALRNQLGHPSRKPRQQGSRRHRGPAQGARVHHDRRDLHRPQAAEMGLVNRAVPLENLRDETIALARKLAAKNPVVLRAAKHGFKRCRELTWEQSEDYLYAKFDQSQLRDPEHGREKGLKQFLDEKSIKPGLESYRR